MNNVNSTNNIDGLNHPQSQLSVNGRKRSAKAAELEPSIQHTASKALAVETPIAEPQNLPTPVVQMAATQSPLIFLSLNTMNFPTNNSQLSPQRSQEDAIAMENRQRKSIQEFCQLLQSWDIDNQDLPPEALIGCYLDLFSYKLLSSYMSNIYASGRGITISPTLCDVLSDREWTRFFFLLSKFHQINENQYQDPRIISAIKMFKKEALHPLPLHLSSIKTLSSLNLQQLAQSQGLKLDKKHMDWRVWNSPSNQSNDLVFQLGEKQFFICRACVERDLNVLLSQYPPNTKAIDLSQLGIDEISFEKILMIAHGCSPYGQWTAHSLLNFAKALLITKSELATKYLNEMKFGIDINTTQETALDALKDFISEIQQADPLIANKLQLIFNQHIEEMTNQYATEPFRHFQYVALIRKHGSSVTSLLNLEVKGGLSSCLHQLFPHAKHFGFQSLGKTEDSLSVIIRNISAQVETLNTNFIPEDFSLADFECCSKLSSLTIAHPGKIDEDSDDKEYVEIRPFENPETMVNLESLTLKGVDLENEEVLNSIAKLPNLKHLVLETCKNIGDLKKIEMLLPKLESLALNHPHLGGESSFFSFKKQARHLPLHTLWKLQQQFPHFKFKLDSVQNLDKRWKQDLTDFKQVIQTSTQHNLKTPYSIKANEVPDASTSDLFNSLITQLSNEESLVFDLSQAQAHLTKMRYSDMLFYDHNHLNEQLGFVLNASPIKGINGKTRIVTQGPLSKTIGDFWSAVWKMNTEFIVMLTACQEGGKEKCAQYWPYGENITLNCQDALGQDFSVTLLKTTPCPFGVIREFELETKEGKRIVHQLHVDQWNDQTALTGEELSQLVHHIYESELQLRTPIFMHCSAGVGRTGVIAACLLIKELLPILLEHTKDQEGKLHPENLQLDVEKLLVALRQQRKGMIQTGEQLLSVVQFFQLEVQHLLSELTPN